LPLATLVRRFARNPLTDYDLKVFELGGVRPHILRPHVNDDVVCAQAQTST
jgi:hypothetical protein